MQIEWGVKRIKKLKGSQLDEFCHIGHTVLLPWIQTSLSYLWGQQINKYLNILEIYSSNQNIGLLNHVNEYLIVSNICICKPNESLQG